jgi:hypothetical protein
VAAQRISDCRGDNGSLLGACHLLELDEVEHLCWEHGVAIAEDIDTGITRDRVRKSISSAWRVRPTRMSTAGRATIAVGLVDGAHARVPAATTPIDDTITVDSRTCQEVEPCGVEADRAMASAVRLWRGPCNGFGWR